jgi:uncharacterized protein (TIGR04255 family)
VAEFSGRLSRAPLVYALCQIRFSPILKMGDLVADIQERLRERYEGFDEENLTGIQISAKGPPVVQAEVRWRFESTDRRSGYVLQNSSLVFHTTRYDDFDTFVPEVMRGFETVADIAKIQRIQRIGLRYVDLIEGDEKTPADKLVHKELCGFSTQLQDVTETISQYIFSGSTNIGQLVLRATRGRHDLALPPDLLPLALKVVRMPNSARTSVFLDTDHFVEKPDAPIPASDLQKVVRELKVPISGAFKKAITDEAVKAWK